MKEQFFLHGPRVGLRPLRPDDADGPYPHWLNDDEVCQFNGHHVFPYDRVQALAFIEAARGNRREIVLAMVVEGAHVGNVALQAIHTVNRSAEFAILIGDRRCWGQGFGHEAGMLLLDHGFAALGLQRIGCGTTEDNVGMQRLATKMGMREEGRRRQAAWKRGRFVDVIEYGVLVSEFRDHNKALGSRA